MNRPALFLLACLLALPSAAVERITRGNLVIEGIPEIPKALIEQMSRYQHGRSAGFAGWTPDGQLTITTRFGNANQLHLVASPLGQRRQVTFFEEPITGASWSPNDARYGMALSKDSGGDENYQLYFLDPRGGDARRLTDGRGRTGDALWSHDGTQLAFSWTARNNRESDIWVDDPADEAPPRLVFEAPEVGWYASDWSPDGKQMLLGRFVSISESYLYVYDLASRTLTEIEPAKEPVGRGNARFARDGKGVYFTSDRGREFRTLRNLELATGKITALSAHINWDVESLTLSRDGRWLAYEVNEEGASRLVLMDLENQQELAGPQLPYGLIGGMEFDPGSTRLGFSMQTPASPTDTWVYDLGSAELVRWTQSEIGPLDPARFVPPALVRYPTFDKVAGQARTIPAWVYKPAGPGPHPVLINIHGGPESQSRPSFSTSAQQWVTELGYAVIAPNVRGSTGYGKSYAALDNGMKREDSVKDIGALLDWIATQPDLDASRVVLIGGSYGGYMVLAGMVHYNDRLQGAIDIVGISNFVTFLTNTADYRRDLRRPEYGDERDPAMYAHLQKISPLNSAERITRPLFVVQGQNDPRVPVTEAEQMVAKIRADGGEVWYLLGLNEGHGFRKRDNVDYYQWAVALFLQQLKAAPAASVSASK